MVANGCSERPGGESTKANKGSKRDETVSGAAMRRTTKKAGLSSEAREAKDMIRKETGIIYDPHMVKHQCLWDPNYPECPDRFSKVLERCEALGLLSRCTKINPREATEAEILTKHSPQLLEILKATEGVHDEDFLEKLSSKYDSIYVHPDTYQQSLIAVGSAIELVNAVCGKKIQNGMAIIRPPGHHAMKNEFCGYCFFNNVALAANHALEQGGISRILIVDWDVHHGQATQQMFYEDPRVVYFSIHRYEHGTFWPNLCESDYHYVGEGRGKGYNFNIPLNQTKMSDADYLAVFQQVLLPMAVEFGPDLVIVSAGYDSALGDEKGEMEVTPTCYAHMLSSLLQLANGKVVVVLEGGYCLKSLAEGAALTLRCLLGDPCPYLPKLPPPCDSIQDTILNVIYAHREYWQCFQFQDTYNLKSEPQDPVLCSVKSDGTVDADETKDDEELDTVARHLPVVKYLGSEERPESYLTRDCYPIQDKEFQKELDAKLNILITNTKLTFAPNKVCLVYDERMMKHKNAPEPSHPEKPERISTIYFRHEEYGLLERCHRLKVVDSVLNGESQSGIAIVRPPGHHAEEDEPCGFCVFNTVSIAAKYAVEVHRLKRVLLVDWDVHHGNGSQHTFESDPRVLYLSLHRYDNGSFFPGSPDANYTVVGSGAGAGFNVNIPWNKHGMTDADYIAAFHRIVLPICYEFAPELVLISAGFDAAVGDPLGGCKVTPEAYGHLTHWLSALANGRVILSLEGGYNVTSISYAMTLCTKALLGDPLPMLQPRLAPCPSAVTTIKNVIRVHSKYWSSLKFDLALPKENVLPDAELSQKTEPFGNTNDMESFKIKGEGNDSSYVNANVITEISNNVPFQSPTELKGSYMLPASPTNEVMPNSMAKLNLDESSSPVKSDEVLHSSQCLVSMKEQTKSLESPMELSEDSSNFMVSSVSSLEGENQVWSQISSTSASESLEMITDNVSSFEFTTKAENEDNPLGSSLVSLPIQECKANIPKVSETDINFPTLYSNPRNIDANSNLQIRTNTFKTSPKLVAEGQVNLTSQADELIRKAADREENRPGSSREPDAGGSSVGGSGASGSPGQPQNLVDYLSDNLQLLLTGQMHAVIPLPSCPHLDAVREVPARGLDVQSPCMECGSVIENWVCLVCYTVHCGRYINGHMIEHGIETTHPLTLSFSDLSVWCYVCEAYVDNEAFYQAKNAVHRSKFGEDMPYAYGD
ncbi:Histone deacetylase Rpd3 [Gryllus bimaculatus]|nr:Histone deacetylase Rpd3 [Gryllus bimaculatus]